MPAPTIKYRRLPGIGGGIFRRSTMWLAEDHLLVIQSTGYSEDYKRFYFADIQGMVIRKTDVGRILNGIFGGLTTLALVPVLVTTDVARIVWGIVAGVFLILLIINLLLGPTCVCHIRTAVQTEPLPSLGRLKRARKVLAWLRHVIGAAQGELNPTEISTRMAELARPSTAAAVAPQSSVEPPIVATFPDNPPQP